MEERDSHDSPDDHHQQHRHNTNYRDQEEEYDDYYNINHAKNVTKKDSNEEMQIISSKSRPHDTYIIQVPKDQIYRIPPPENAEIVERYRNPVQTNQSGRRRCAYWFLSIFFMVAFIISLFVCLHHFTLKPKNPTFSIKHIATKNPTPSKKNASPGFQVSVETTNTNSVNDIGYEQGSAKLAYKGKEIGHGSFPALENEASGKTDTMDVVIATSSKGGLPKELQPPSSNNKKNSKPLNLNLSMSIPLKLKTWLYTKKVDVKVGCDFEVNTMGENMKVLSQKCDIKK